MKIRKLMGFSGYSGSGKTALIEKLIVNMKARGLQIAVIKHDVHGLDIDREGKDSKRFTDAGADVTIVSSPGKTAMIEQRPQTLFDNIAMARDVDLILVEGYKDAPIPQIGICRKETGQGLPYPPEHYLAVVTDENSPAGSVPAFPPEAVDAITDFILENALPF